MCCEFQGLIHFLWIFPNFQRLLKNQGWFKPVFLELKVWTFSTSNLVSDSIKFSIFGHDKLKIWFFKDCRAKRKFSKFLGNEFLRTCHFLSISIDHFKLDFMKRQVSLGTLNPHFWTSIFERFKVLFHNIVLILHKCTFFLVGKGFVSICEW